MATFTNLIDGAKYRADLKNTERTTLTDWAALATEAIDNAWHLAAGARPDFQFTSADFTVVSGNSASFLVPGNFHTLIDVVYGPDTTSEYSLGPFAWQNRKAPGNWFPWFVGGPSGGAQRARLMGRTIYLEPATSAGGPYRLWYCPKPKAPRFVVRLTATSLPAFTAAGAGVGKTLTENASTGVLTIDGVSVALGDRILVRLGTVNDGIYTATAMTPGASWVLTRSVDYDQDLEISIGDNVLVTEGTANTGAYFELTVFAGVVDTNAMTFGPGGAVDQILTQFAELLKISMAIPAMLRDDDLDTRPLDARRQVLEAEMREYFGKVRNPTANTKPIDTDLRGPGLGWGWGGW